MRAPAGAARRVPLLIGLAVVGLIAVVALASGDPIIGHRGDRPVEEGFASLSAVWWAVMVLCASFALAVVIYLLVMMRGQGKGAKPGQKSLIGLLVLVAIVMIAIRFRPERSDRSEPVQAPTTTSAPAPVDGPSEGGSGTAWWPLLAVAVLAVGGAVIGLRARRPPLPDLEDDEESMDATLPALLALGIEALRAEPDPRRAVIAAYARLEAGLAASGQPRRANETPSEFLARLLAASGLPPDALSALTHLYELARFSDRPLPSDARAQALASLDALESRINVTRIVVG